MTSSAKLARLRGEKTFKGYVFIHLPDEFVAVSAGLLAMVERGITTVRSQFGYGARYLRRPNALPVDPLSLPLAGAVPGSDREEFPVSGLLLFGAIRDASPDSWGRRVIESKLQVPANSLPESEYLMQAGSERFGALDLRPDLSSGPSDDVLPPASDLGYLLDAADRIANGEIVPPDLQRLYHAGSAMGGARPKALVTDKGRMYLAKFPVKDDAFDVPLVEYATLELARECDLNVPAVHLAPLPDGRNIMLIERFDRQPDPDGKKFTRRHTVSALTMLGLHESESSTSAYAAIANATAKYGGHGIVATDHRELFARMVFNILVSNDDDHLRNHAYVFDRQIKGWRLSPLYDVVPKPQIGFERFLHLAVGPRGRLATLDNALEGCRPFGLDRDEAAHIIDHIYSRVREWRVSFERYGVDPKSCDRIASAFRRGDDVGLKEIRETMVAASRGRRAQQKKASPSASDEA